MRPARIPSGPGLLRRTSMALSAVMVATLLQAVAAPASMAAATNLPGLPASEKPVESRRDQAVKPRAVTKGPRIPAGDPWAALPAAGETTAVVPAAAAKGGARFARPKGQPIGIGRAEAGPKAGETDGRTKSAPAATPSSPAEVTSRVLDRKAAARAGVNGLVFTLTAKPPTVPNRTVDGSAETPVAVSVDYKAFAESHGGAYASRMRLIELPACALTTPDRPECRKSRAVDAVNGTDTQTLTTDAVSLRVGEPTVLAAVAAAAGDKGDYTATPLSPSSTWDTSLNTGDFTWSYDIQTPEVPGGLKPSVGLSYSSAAIDGRTGGTNNQGSWAGDGFNLWPGFIERRYKPCADDGVKNADGNKPGDMCWAYDNAFISFNGSGGELVPAGKDEFKLKRDDGTRITRLESADRANGDNDNEYWRLTSPDGTRYFFGYNRLPGWTTGKPTTDSTWTLPVYGNNTGEECHGASFAESWCQQAWRWNLDYVVDTHGNAMSYHYAKEENSYGRNLKADDDTPYTRGGYLKRIDYGQRSDDLYTAKPFSQVVFHSDERCLPQTGVTCAANTIDTKAPYWYDTPWDLNCKAGTKCDNGRLSPSFWTRKRLTGITTQVLLTDETYGKVDSWKLEHRWGMADTDYQLLLDSIQHTGESATPAITLPKTTFAYTQLANRLDKTGDGFAPFIKARLSTIDDEYGGQVVANYSAPACNWSALPTPETNTTRCFPQYIGGSDSDPATEHWFNKYVTTSVTESDRTGGAPDQVTSYQYLGDAAWRYNDDDGLTKEKEKTWSQWHGYGHVRVGTGGEGGDAAMKTQQDSYFLRGMNGDRKNKSGGTKSVSVALAAGEGEAITDHEAMAGFGYKAVTFDKPGGKVLTKSVSRPWYHETAKKVRDWGTVTANLTGTSSTKTWTSLDNGAGAKWRTTSAALKQDTVAGRVVQADDFGDDSTPDDDRCTRTTYTSNTTGILNSPARVETVSKACAATPDRAKDVLSDTRTAYDGGAYGSAPTKGDTTATAVLKSHDGSKATYLESGATYDVYGRQLTTTDLTANVTVTGSAAPVRTARADGRTNTTAYIPAKGSVTQVKTTTPPAKTGDAGSAQTTTVDIDPLRGVPRKETDTNGNVTDSAHDALGRLSKVWLADRRTSQTPSRQFVYTVAESTPVSVATKTLSNSGGQITSYALYDGFLRDRQTQSPGPEGGTVVDDVFYDERGLAVKTFAPYYVTGKPSANLVRPVDDRFVETQIHTTYDGLNRPVETRQVASDGDGGTVLSTTKSMYGGDRTTVIPPVGGTTTTTIADARGQTTELRQHHTRAADATFDTVSYRHTPRGELSKVTDTAGNAWTYTYDQLGRQTSTTDPDKGTTNSTYDDRNQLVFSKGSRTDVPGLAYLYDGLGRQTEVREGSETGTLRTKQVYDTISNAKGQLAESIRYADGNAYSTKVTQYDSLYRATRTSVVIPAAEGKLAGTYQTGATFKPSGLPDGTNYSAAGSLPGGSYGYIYEDETLRTIGVQMQGMTSSISYSNTGKPLQQKMGLADGGKKVQVNNTYETGTQRLATTRVDREDQPGVDRHATYTYDEAGNIRSIADVSRTGTDNQCFTYDYLTRLTEAWTQSTTTCETGPSAGKIGGPAPYWHSYGYDKTGNRTAETRHDVTGDVSKEEKRTYAYPEPGTKQAHSLTSRTTIRTSGTVTESYDYDTAGNTTARPGQNLTWDAEGHLATVAEDGKTTSYLYDTAGNRLISRTPTETTLYLGHTEVTLAPGADKAKATRYTDLGGGHTAVLNDDGTFDFTIGDHHGTGQLAIRADNLAITQRRALPFGGTRGTAPTEWPGTKGFVGGTDDTDSTGLTHLGAREYDPDLGRFISVDPLLDLADPQQMNGYNYANNNPTTLSDPTGLRPDGSCGGSGSCNVGSKKEPKWESWTYDGGGAWSWGWSSDHSSTSSSGGYSTTVTTWSHFNSKSGFSYTLSIQQVKQAERKAPPLREIYAMGTNPSWKGYERPTSGAEDLSWLCPSGASESNCSLRKSLYLAQSAFGAIAGVRSAAGARGRSSSPCSPGNSFVAGTVVLMADGSTKLIEDIELGDKVLATDPETGETTPRAVTAEIMGQGVKHLVGITIDVDGERGNATASVTATDGHPFWVAELGEWIDATDLRGGDWLRTSTGTYVQITAVERWEDPSETVYNLTVRDVHTYYVLAGATPVLVHNCGSRPDGPDPDGNIVYRALAENDDPTMGLTARAPGNAGVSPLSHVAGKKLTPWISTTKNPSIAFDKYNQGHGVVAIDLRRIPYSYVDISSGPFPSSRRHSAYARKDSEVLVRQNIPAEAIVGHWPGG
ncbi:polymorphic toxin-type HINT domain-containing protein [Streptomyces griseus]|uniref:polymorphic toxin-type HINT domain-containing protein n=1 Tax=Streptomyces griseus TaxID=1911 RepID=UPI0038150733